MPFFDALISTYYKFSLNITPYYAIPVVQRALAFHQCGPGSIPGLGAICELSLLVLYSASRAFSLGTKTNV